MTRQYSVLLVILLLWCPSPHKTARAMKVNTPWISRVELRASYEARSLREVRPQTPHFARKNPLRYVLASTARRLVDRDLLHMRPDQTQIARRKARDLRTWNRNARLGYDRIRLAISRLDRQLRSYRPFGVIPSLRDWSSHRDKGLRSPHSGASMRVDRDPMTTEERLSGSGHYRIRPLRPAHRVKQKESEVMREIMHDLKHFKLLKGIPSWAEMEGLYQNVTQSVREKLDRVKSSLTSPFEAQIDRMDTEEEPSGFSVSNYLEGLLLDMSNEIKAMKIGNLPSINDVTEMSEQLKHRVRQDVETKLGITLMKKLDTSLSLKQEPLEFLNTFLNITLDQGEYANGQELLDDILLAMDPLNITQKSIEAINSIDAQVEDIKTLLNPKTAINAEVDLQNVKDLTKMIPTLIPILFDMYVPKLEHVFHGTNFTMEELYILHEHLLSLQKFLQETQDDLRPERAPTMIRLFDLLLERNLRIMALILALMVEADASPGQTVTLTDEDLMAFKKHVILPKELMELFQNKV